MEIKDIKRLLDAISNSDVSEFSYEKGDFRVAIKRQTGQSNYENGSQTILSAPTPVHEITQSPAVRDQDGLTSSVDEVGVPGGGLVNEVTAAIVGTFYLSPAPEAPPYVKVGDQVEEGTVLCIIEAMKLMNEIEAESAGIIAEIFVQNEEPVEYGQPLFRIDPVH